MTHGLARLLTTLPNCSYLLTTLPICSLDLAHLLTTLPICSRPAFAHDLAHLLTTLPICSRPSYLLTTLPFAHDLPICSHLPFAHDLAICSRPCPIAPICPRPCHLLTTCPFAPSFAHDLLNLLTTLPTISNLICSRPCLCSQPCPFAPSHLLTTLPNCSFCYRDARYPTSQFSDLIRLRHFPYLILRPTVSFFRYLDYNRTNKYCSVLGELMLTSSQPKRGIRNKRYLNNSFLISFRLSLSCSSAL